MKFPPLFNNFFGGWSQMSLIACAADIVGLIALYIIDTSIALKDEKDLLKLCLLLCELERRV